MADEPTPEIPVPTPSEAAPPPPAPPAAPTTAAFDPAAPAPVKKRKIWPFVLGGAILVFVLLIVALVVTVLTVFGALGGDPKKTVTDYDLSFKKADCALFQSTTTTEFQDGFFGKDFDCATWVDNAKGLTVDGEYAYSVRVVSSEVQGSTAEVVTDETDSTSGDPVDYSLRYYLVQTGGHWLIDGIDNETE
ncbi:MAG: hypothetical protein JWR04_2733 [Rhodoglobus sp.]|nr:hypothetical protein [Rhodoglobus sp.]